MNVAGIICEFNPLHKGHAWMMEEVRRQGAEAIVCAMSGNFVQRGEAAAADKFTRAEMAVRCGADLVLVSKSCCMKASASTRSPISACSKQPATPALRIRSG